MLQFLAIFWLYRIKDGSAFDMLFNLKNATKYMRTLLNYMNILKFFCFDLAMNCCSFLIVYWSIMVKDGPVFGIPTIQVEKYYKINEIRTVLGKSVSFQQWIVTVFY